MAESALTGGDVLTEVISANRRLQGGMKASTGGINFEQRENTLIPKAQKSIDILNHRLAKPDGER
tara:strand:+ start:2038 stop:2232 length:195 start_codon:yes stop_codon:yes gene_type:complete